MYAGTFQLTPVVPTPLVATTAVGRVGEVRGVVEDEATDASEFPTRFVATAVNVYAVPLVNPVTTQVNDVVVHVLLPGFEVTV